MCPGCKTRTSPTAGTIFDRTRTPLTVWFMACWLFATQKDGISALGLQRALGIGSYQTAWAMLHRLRSVLVRPGRELLQGRVEVDETYIGGEEPGLAGGRAKGKKALVGIAVERFEPKGLGRCRMAWMLDASSASLRAFLIDHVQPGATVISDGWQPYRPATKDLYVHERVVAPAAKASDLLPGVHRTPRSRNAGCLALTRAPSRSRTSQATSTSSSFGSTADAHAAAAWSSTACSNSPSPMIPSATAT